MTTTRSTRRVRRLARLSLLVALLSAPLAPAQAEEVPEAPHVPAVAVLAIEDRTEGRWPGLDRAIYSWSRTRFVEVVKVTSCDALPETYCATAVVGEYGAESPFEGGWIGLAEPTGYGRANLYLNTAHADYSTPFGRHEIAATACHEIGHLFGIGHPEYPDGVSVDGCLTNSGWGKWTRTVRKTDREALRAVRANPLAPEVGFGVFFWEAVKQGGAPRDSF